MTSVTFICDRCNAQVIGEFTSGGTGGFYNVTPGGSWDRYGLPGEVLICDDCVQQMPLYKETYGYK